MQIETLYLLYKELVLFFITHTHNYSNFSFPIENYSKKNQNKKLVDLRDSTIKVESHFDS